MKQIYNNINLEKFLDMASYRRQGGSKSELAFIEKYIDCIPEVYIDESENRVVKIGTNSRTLFTAHTDDVSRKNGRRKVSHCSKSNLLFVTSKNECLGGDDLAGIYILLHMIRHAVPGIYLFARYEECGGEGSYEFSQRVSENNIILDRAISFDRKGHQDVITHQFGRRCCSDKFALELAQKINMNYKPCRNGIFTDSYNFIDLVPECTNVSVGYYNEHTNNEFLDLKHLDQLLGQLVKVDFECLPVKRKI